jgi:hypothetical protein
MPGVFMEIFNAVPKGKASGPQNAKAQLPMERTTLLQEPRSPARLKQAGC